jgi:hypothetical protein
VPEHIVVEAHVVKSTKSEHFNIFSKTFGFYNIY